MPRPSSIELRVRSDLSQQPLFGATGNDGIKNKIGVKCSGGGADLAFRVCSGIVSFHRSRCIAMGNPFTNDPGEVSARMKLIRGKNTKPEVLLFSILSDSNVGFR